MNDVQLTLIGVLGAAAGLAFISFILLGTTHASARRLGFWLTVFGLGVFATLAYDLGRLAAVGLPAEGVIEAVVWHRKAAHPVVRFTTGDGQEYTFRCRQGVSRGVYAVGQTVPVFYLESNPPFAVVATNNSLWSSLAAGAAFGLVPTVGGVRLVLRRPTPRG